MTVDQLAAEPSLSMNEDFVKLLDVEAVSDLACVNVLRGRRR
jgi:hypothetical protein